MLFASTVATSMWTYISDIFIVIYLSYALFWDSPESTWVGITVKSILRPFIVRTGLSYRWNMYSGPFTHIVEIEARACYSDGTTLVIALPPRFEFRRYCFMLARRQRAYLFEVFADFAGSRLVRHTSQPVEITVVKRIAIVPACPRAFWARFDAGSGPEFQETLMHKRILR